MTDIRSDPGTGELVGARYLLLDRIGRGGSAEVFRAQDTRVPRQVAVKLVRGWSTEAEASRRLRSEAALLAGLAHPALVTLHDAGLGEDGEAPYLVMELIDGADLAKAAGSMTTPEIVSVVADVARALAHAHSRGIVHRDVKPGNVLVVRDEQGPRGKLADLGIAHLTGATRATAKGTIVGTVAYLSPEQARGEDVTAKTDVYSLALLLIEALTGERAFTGTEAETFVARLNRPPALPTGLTEADSALLRAMTARDPDERPEASAVAAALGGWTSAPPREPLPPTARSVTSPAVTTDDLATAEAAPPTRVLPSPHSAVGESAPTAALPVGGSRRATDHRDDRLRMTAAVALAAAAAVLAASIGIAVATAPPEPEPTTSYPALDGELGDAYRDLQELIEP